VSVRFSVKNEPTPIIPKMTAPVTKECVHVKHLPGEFRPAIYCRLFRCLGGYFFNLCATISRFLEYLSNYAVFFFFFFLTSVVRPVKVGDRHPKVGDGHRVGFRSAPAARSGADAAGPLGRLDGKDRHLRAEPGKPGPQKPRGPTLEQPRSRVSREEEADDPSVSSRSRDLRPID